jgi:hypothetical protein
MLVIKFREHNLKRNIDSNIYLKEYLLFMFKVKLILLFLALAGYTLSQSGVARCTYHLYAPSTPLTSVACSDGANGIIKWGYKDLSPMFPYVTAWQEAAWNSPKCGDCI